MTSIDQLLLQIEEIEGHLGYHFKNKSLLVQAFTHRSFFNEHRHLAIWHNERLEFLGDSVLGLIVSQYLYQQKPEESEGQLSHFRSYIVDAASCVLLLQKLSVAPYILLGRGERLSSRGKESILADLFEALIGAIYLDSSFTAVQEFFLHHFTDHLETILAAPLRNWKAELQDLSQKKHQRPPVYKVTRETGPEHSKMFYITVCVEDVEVGHGLGSSKKLAEQSAAEDALRKMHE